MRGNAGVLKKSVSFGGWCEWSRGFVRKNAVDPSLGRGTNNRYEFLLLSFAEKSFGNLHSYISIVNRINRV